jgi:hypothetical protein
VQQSKEEQSHSYTMQQLFLRGSACIIVESWSKAYLAVIAVPAEAAKTGCASCIRHDPPIGSFQGFCVTGFGPEPAAAVG